MTEKYSICKVSPDLQHVWGIFEWFHWSKEINNILKKDLDNSQLLFNAAYDSINWDKYYEKLKGTIFYNWATKTNYGFIDFGGPAHILEGRCFAGKLKDRINGGQEN